jgi:membrane protease YdiL (CAAX protease family)
MVDHRVCSDIGYRDDIMALRNILAEKSLLSFFLLTYIISWGIWVPIVLYYYLSPFPISLENTPIRIIMLAFLGLFGPTFAALIMSWLQDGSRGVKRLLSRWKTVHVGIRWYLFIPIINTVTTLAAIQFNITFLGRTPQINWGLWYLFFTDFLRWMIIGGPIAEETGWRGYALPRLMTSRNALNASLILGGIWGCWHLPLLFIPGAAVPVPFEPSILLIYVLNGVSLSVIFTWLYNNTGGSVFVSYLFHAGVNSIPNTFLTIYHFGAPEVTYWNTIWLIIIGNWVFALIITLFFGSTYLSRKFKDDSGFRASVRMLGSEKVT